MISAGTIHYCIITLAFLQYNLIVHFNNINENFNPTVLNKEKLNQDFLTQTNLSNQSL